MREESIVSDAMHIILSSTFRLSIRQDLPETRIHNPGVSDALYVRYSLGCV